MCLTSFSSFSLRNQLESTRSVKRKLKKVFKELANRCGSFYLGRDEFLRFAELPGLLGEQVFNALDEDEDNKLDAKEFVIGMCTIFQGELSAITDFLFRMFNFSRNGQITRADIKCLLEYLPITCKKCFVTKKIEIDIQEKVDLLFKTNKYLFYENFHDRITEENELGELMLESIINLMPEVFHSIFFDKYQSDTKIQGFLYYKNRRYYASLKDSAIYYSLYQGSQPKGIILVKGLFIEKVMETGFSLKNNKLQYEFKADTSETQEKWVKELKSCCNSRDISIAYTKSKNIIGRGAYGKVKLAKSNKTQETVAIKIISKEPLDPRSETRLRREISILKICKHENIVELKDIYETFEKLYIVTDYIQGGSLFSWLKTRDFKVHENVSKILVYQISNAISYLHAYGIFHRDIKLENILLDTCNGFKPKIIDFGLSCILGPGQHSQEAVGTLKYASPELISRIPYRETPDIWGIGVVLYILLIGKTPFYGENDQEIANRILKKKIDTDNEKWTGVSQDAKDLLNKLLTRKPSDRIKLHEILTHTWFKDVGELDINNYLY